MILENLADYYNDNNPQTSYTVLDENEIQYDYNVYGFYYEDENFEDNLEEYRNERNDEWLEYLETTDLEDRISIQEWIEDFQDGYSYDSSKNESCYGRPTKFIEYTDDDYVSSLDDYFTEEGEPLSEEDFCDESKLAYYSFYDGSNYKKVYIGDNNEDVTEDYQESFDNKVFVGTTRTNSGTSHEEYYYNADLKQMWIEHISYYQGVENTWSIIEDEYEILINFVRFANDEIKKYFSQYENCDLDVIRSFVFGKSKGEGDNIYGTDYEYTIFDKNEAVDLGSYVNDPYTRLFGGDYYQVEIDGETKYIVYTWSAYQGDWCGYSFTDLTLEEITEKCS